MRAAYTAAAFLAAYKHFACHPAPGCRRRVLLSICADLKYGVRRATRIILRASASLLLPLRLLTAR